MSTLWIRHAPSSASLARKSVLAAFLQAGLTEDEAFDAALIASELVGNAVRHAPALPSGQLALDWSLDRDGYLISVTDGGGPREINVRQASVSDTSGRGLMIVAALSSSWGSSSQPDSTTVWARGRYQNTSVDGNALSSS